MQFSEQTESIQRNCLHGVWIKSSSTHRLLIMDVNLSIITGSQQVGCSRQGSANSLWMKKTK